jgi:hypothetical protein
LTWPGNSNVNSTGIARSPGKIKVTKLAPGGVLHPAGEDNPVPGAKRKIIAPASVVIARNRPVRTLISSRDQAMLAARRSCCGQRSGAAILSWPASAPARPRSPLHRHDLCTPAESGCPRPATQTGLSGTENSRTGKARAGRPRSPGRPPRRSRPRLRIFASPGNGRCIAGRRAEVRSVQRPAGDFPASLHSAEMRWTALKCAGQIVLASPGA